MSIPVYLLRSAPISKETPNGGKNYAQLHSNQKGPKGQKDAERGDTPNKTAPPSRTPQSLHNRGSNNNSLHLDLDFYISFGGLSAFRSERSLTHVCFQPFGHVAIFRLKTAMVSQFSLWNSRTRILCVFVTVFSFFWWPWTVVVQSIEYKYNALQNYLLSFVDLFSIRDFQIIFIGFKEKGNNVQFKYWTWEEWSITQLNQYMKCKTL